ncbi:MAG TPA: hypothetical protein VKX35_00095 [Fermentimonas sp.]|nr:hypothetical protein [Fermentimonas sp.]
MHAKGNTVRGVPGHVAVVGRKTAAKESPPVPGAAVRACIVGAYSYIT